MEGIHMLISEMEVLSFETFWICLFRLSCVCSTNPYGEMYYDGISIDPFEVMFVKVKEILIKQGWIYAVRARQYDAWLTEQVFPDIMTKDAKILV